jgi:hypothetical protein
MLASLSTQTTADRDDRRPWTRAQEAAAIGVSARWYRTLRAREREREAEALPYVPLVDRAARGLHYRLDRDEESVLPECPFRVGNGGCRRGWTVKHKEDRQTRRPEPPRPSEHKFVPNGQGRKKNRCVVA